MLFSATLVFNPIAYALITSVGWRLTYVIFGGLLFVVGIVTDVTLRPLKEEEVSEECKPELKIVGCQGEYEKIEDEPVSNGKGLTYTKSAKVLLMFAWLVASSFKCIGYYIPIYTLVGAPNLSNKACT